MTVAGLAVPTAPATAANSASAAAAGQVAGYHALSPTRLMDTRTGLGGTTGPVGPGGVATLHVPVPPGATAVVLNVAGTEPTAATFVTVYPAFAPRPNASNLNLVPGETRANLVTVAIGGDGHLAFYNNAGNTHVIADLAGYYGGGGEEAGFTALPPNRVLDTRDNNSPVGPNGTIELDLSNRVPASATAVSLSLAGVTDAGAPDTFVTAWPAGTARPLASNLNLTQNEARPIAVTVALGAGRKLSLYNHVGTVHLVVDLAGFYTPDYGAMFQSVVPQRVLDTRNGTGAPVGPVGPNQRLSLDFNNVAPPQAVGVVMNLAGTEATAFTFVTALPGQTGQSVTTSNLNLAPGQTAPNMVNVPLGPSGFVDLYNHVGNVHLVADFAGYFVFSPSRCLSGCVAAFGYAQVGENGVGLRGQLDRPRTVFGLSDATAVAGAGPGVTGYALRSDGTVVAWGLNAQGELGNGWSGGDGLASGGRSLVPVPVLGLDRATAIAAGRTVALALRDNGTVWRWGAFRENPTVAVTVAEQVPELTGVTAIAAGRRTGYALRSDHTVWAWGENSAGQLGNGSQTGWSDNPVQVSGLTDVVSIAAAESSAFAVKADGTVFAWGDNNSGQLGTGTQCQPGLPCFSAVPVQVAGLTGITAVASDGAHVFAVEGTAAVWGWGSNFNGALGTGVPCDSNCVVREPARLPGLTDVTSVAVASFSGGGLASRSDGTVWGWGQGAQIPSPSSVPVQQPDLSGVTSVAATGYAGLALVPNSR